MKLPAKKKPANLSEQLDVDNVPILGMKDWLPYNFSVLANRVSACLFEMYNKRYGLSVSGWRIMAVLGPYQPLSAKDVAQHTAMDQVSVTRAINQMDGLGLITRRTDASDRRKITLRLSEKGEAARREIVPLALALERAMVSSLTKQELTSLKTIISKLTSFSESEFIEPSNWPEILKNHSGSKEFN